MHGGDLQAEGTTADAPKLRVFLSYSRKDAEFVGRLAEALTARGYLADFDRSPHDKDNVTTGISAEDDWWKRLQEMIELADAMVFVVTPDSVGSKVCDEEIVYARSLGKRVIPVLRREIDFATAPPRLAALNIKIALIGEEPAVFDAGAAALSAALDRDVAWLREQTRLILAVADWEKSGRREDELLRGVEISEAEAWSARRPPSAPEVPEPVLLFLARSREAQAAREETERRSLKRQRALWRWVGGLVLVAMVATLAGAWFVMQGQRQVARRMSAAIAQQAGEAYDQRRYDRALRLAVLASHDAWLSPAASEGGFEIGKAMAATRLEARFPNIDGAYCLSVNVDGTLVLAVSKDAPRLFARDARGEWAEQDLPGADMELTNCAAFAPDGKSFVTTSIGKVMLWASGPNGWTGHKLEAGSDKPLVKPVVLASGRVFALTKSTIVVWTPDGKGGWSRELLEDEQTARADESLDHVQASADGKRLLSVSSAAIQVWTEGEDGKWTSDELLEVDRSLGIAALSPDGKRIVVKAYDEVQTLMEDNKGIWFNDESRTIKPSEDNAIIDVLTSPNGRLMLTAGTSTPRLRFAFEDDGRYSLAHVENFAADFSGFSVASFSADSNAFMASGVDGTVKVWTLNERDVLEGPNVSAPIRIVGEEHILEQALSGDGSVAATVGSQGPLEIWRLGNGATKRAALAPPNITRQPNPVAYSPSSKHLVGVDVEGNLVVWEQNEAERKAEIVTGMSASSYVGMPNETTVVTNGGNGLVVFSRDNAAKWGEGKWTVEMLDKYHGDWASASGDGRRIVAPSDILEVKIWTRGDNGKWTSEKLEDDDYHQIDSASISADGTAIAAVDAAITSMWQQDKAGVWKPQVVEGVSGYGLRSVAFGAGKVFVTASATGTLLWSPKADGTWTFERVSGAEFPADHAELSPSGRTIVTTKDGAPARVWTKREDGKWIGAALGDAANAKGAALAPDGHEVTLLLESGPTVFDASWLTQATDPRSVRRAGTELAKQACATKLGGGGVGGMRKLSAKDTEAAPIVGARAGEDVCAWRPAWYDGVLDSLFGWMG